MFELIKTNTNLLMFFYRIQNLLAPATPSPSGNFFFSESVPSESPSTYNDSSNEEVLNLVNEPGSQNQLSYSYDEPLSHFHGRSEVEFSNICNDQQSLNLLAEPYIVKSNINSDPLNHTNEPISLANHLSDRVRYFKIAFHF